MKIIKNAEKKPVWFLSASIHCRRT